MIKLPSILLFVFLSLILVPVYAQPGITEMNQATGSLRSTFLSARDATFVLAGILGICGAANIYYNMQIGKDKFTVKITAWFFAAFFVILMGPFLQALFGI